MFAPFIASHHVAWLFAFPSPGDKSAINDMRVVKEGLLRRGLNSTDITISEVSPTGDTLKSTVASLCREVPEGSAVIVYVSGNGTANRQDLSSTIAPNAHWDDFFQPMRKTSKVTFEMIADTGPSNLVYGRVPANVSVLGIAGTWRDISGTRATGLMVHSGTPLQCGVMSYIVGRELPYATNMADLAARVSAYKNSGSMGAIWFNGPTCQVYGPGLVPIPGEPRKV